MGTALEDAIRWAVAFPRLRADRIAEVRRAASALRYLLGISEEDFERLKALATYPNPGGTDWTFTGIPVVIAPTTDTPGGTV